jgi:hypothetical protein
VHPTEEPPLSPDLVVSLDKHDAEEVAYAIVDLLVKRGLLPSLYSL